MPITKVIATELESVAMMGVNAGNAHLLYRSHLYQNIAVQQQAVLMYM